MDQSHKITVYSANATNRSLFAILMAIFRELPEAHELGLRLFKRNLKAMYRQSLLGFAWLVPPLITAALWIFLRGSNVMSVGDTGIPYPVFVLIGTMMWQIFSEAMQAPIKNVISNKSMLVKINIPREALLLSGIYEVLFNVLIKLGLLVIIFVVFKQAVGVSLLLAPIGILSLLLCGFSLGLILTPIGPVYGHSTGSDCDPAVPDVPYTGSISQTKRWRSRVGHETQSGSFIVAGDAELVHRAAD